MYTKHLSINMRLEMHSFVHMIVFKSNNVFYGNQLPKSNNVFYGNQLPKSNNVFYGNRLPKS